jgi:hypothetical protein
MIAAIGSVIVLVTALLAIMLGVPAGFVAGALQNRVEADTGYRLRIGGNSTVALWPSPALIVRDISLFDANDADPLGKLTAERMRFSITFSSLFAGHPHIAIELHEERSAIEERPLRLRIFPSTGCNHRRRHRRALQRKGPLGESNQSDRSDGFSFRAGWPARLQGARAVG